MERWSNATFVGEPTAQNVKMYGDNEKIVLPNSGLTARTAYLWWQQMDPRTTRACTAPHVPAILTSVHDRQGRDPALEAILESHVATDPTSAGEIYDCRAEVRPVGDPGNVF